MRCFFKVLLLGHFLLACTACAQNIDAQQSINTKQIPEIKGEIQLKILKGSANGAAYVSIYNPTREVITLREVSIVEDVVGSVELHDHVQRKDENGQEYMEMIQIPEMEIQPGGTLILSPGSKHLMLMKIKPTLCAFKALNFIFSFRNTNNKIFELTQKVNLKTTKRCE